MTQQSTNGGSQHVQSRNNSTLATLQTITPAPPLTVNDIYSLFQGVPTTPTAPPHLDKLAYHPNKDTPQNTDELCAFATKLERLCENISFPNGIVNSDGRFTAEAAPVVSACANIQGNTMQENRQRLQTVFDEFHTALSNNDQDRLMWARIEIFTYAWALGLLLSVTSSHD